MAKTPKSAPTEPTPKKKGGKGGTPATTKWHAAFLKAFSETGIVSTGCDAAKIARSTAYDHRDLFPEFAKHWDEAEEVAADMLEQEAYRRAKEGTAKAVFYKGVRVDDGEVREYSDTLLIFLLKARRPERYREHFDHRISGPDGGALQINIIPAKLPDPKPGDGDSA